MSTSTAARPSSVAVGEGGRAASVLRTSDGSIIALPVDRWRAEPSAEECVVLARARPPVLDVGCGPGRHVLHLAGNGVLALGLDASPAAVAMARQTGAPVLERSIFARVPGAGRWRTALLLDGNIGIGGDPVALLRRLAALLAPGGSVLVEMSGPGSRTRVLRARVERGSHVGPWFRWAVVGGDDIAGLGDLAGFHATPLSTEGGRWFAELRRR